MDLLSDMKLFRRIAMLKSLSAAGRESSLSPGAVSQRLRALEFRYGTPLLTRSTRAVTLTPEGRIFLDYAERMLADAESLQTAIGASQGPLKGPLRVSAPSDLGRQYVAPMLVDFVAAHPAVQPELYLLDDVTDLVGSGIDIAFRYGKLEDSSLVSRPLAENARAIVASPDYLARYGTPERPADLARHRCLVLVRNGERMPWSLTVDGKRVTPRLEPALSANDGEMLRQWALAGLGLTYKSHVDVAADIAASRLTPVLSQYMSANVGLHLIFPSARSCVPRIRGFLNFAVERFRTLSTRLAQV
jgi:DNA-binding transcriptional LysR family regulator